MFDEIRRLAKDGRCAEVVEAIRVLENSTAIPPNILVLKGMCGQLEDENDSYTLDDIERTYQKALSIDEDYVPALIELAWFYLNVCDDAARAKPLFERAYNLGKDVTLEAATGVVACTEEVDGRDEAMNRFKELLPLEKWDEVMSRPWL